ncbi:MAG TPA: dockerin type I repeat-containing protein, partial [Armatimonadota bacterium]
LTLSGNGTMPTRQLVLELKLDPAVAVPVANSYGLASATAQGTAAAAGGSVMAAAEEGRVTMALMSGGGTFVPQGPLISLEITLAANAAPGAYSVTADEGTALGAGIQIETVTFVPGQITILGPGGTDPSTSLVYGDTDGDGKVTIRDVLLLLKAVIGLSQLTADQVTRSDVAPVDALKLGDGKVNVADAVRVLRRVAGLEADPWPGGPNSPGTPSDGSVTLGPDGGILSSSDGRLRAVVPAGALARSTKLSVSFVDNGAPLGVGKAFSLQPEGITFSKPVALTFAFTDDDLNGSAPEHLRVAYEDAQGLWHGLKVMSVDPVAHTITVSTTHFSKWAMYERYSMVPGYKDVLAGLNASFQILEAPADPTDGSDAPKLPPTPQSMLFSNPMVNGIPGGNSSVGTFKALPGKKATYGAPQKAPGQNPVTLSATITTEDLANVILISRVRVIPRDWSASFEYKRTKSCGPGGLDNWEQNDGWVADFSLNDDFQIVNASSSLAYLATFNGGSCMPQAFSVQHVQGRPMEFGTIRGSYVPGTGQFNMSVEMRTPDFVGAKVYDTQGKLVLEVPVEETIMAPSPYFTIPATNGATIPAEGGDVFKWKQKLSLSTR